MGLFDQDPYLERAKPSNERWARHPRVFELPERWHLPVVILCIITSIVAASIGVTLTVSGSSYQNAILGLTVLATGWILFGAEWVQREDSVGLKTALSVTVGTLIGLGGWLARGVDVRGGLFAAIFQAAPVAIHVVIWPLVFLGLLALELRQARARAATKAAPQEQ